MVTLTKNQILTCLENVSREIENICNYQNVPIKNFLSNLTMTDLRVYMFISKLRYLSYYEDAFIDSIDNDDIDLSDLRNRIFVDENTKNRFSNKQIVKFIRNAFSHSNAEKELYQISVNGRYLEIHLKNVNPCEFHIRMSFADLDKLVEKLRTVNFYLSIFENNKFKRYYLKNKITEDDFLNIYSYLERKEVISETEYSKAVIEYYKDTGKIYEIKEYEIMPEQLKQLNNINDLFNDSINKLNKNGNTHNKPILVEAFREHQLSKIIPLQEEKLSMKDDNMLFIKLMCEYPNYSFSELENEFLNTGYNILNNAPLNEVQNAIYSNIGNHPARLLLFSGGNLENDTYIEYISYYIMNICNEETIKIDNKAYLTEHIRNAFAHGRWFIDCEHNLVLCDAKNGKYNDYNFYWKEKINILDLLNVVYQKQMGNEKVRALIRN